MIKKTLGGGINLIYLPGDKFKTVYIRMNIYRPLGKEAAKNALLARVLKSGSKKYNSKQELEKQLENLYGAALIADVSKVGDVQVISFGISIPGDRYTGTNSAGQAAQLLNEIVFNPDVVSGTFKKETVEIEKNNLKNMIESLYNDKKNYAEQKCSEIMFEGQPYAECEYGNIEEIDKIGEKTLKEHYNSIISGPIDIYVSGSCDIDEVAKVFENVKSTGKVPENKAENLKTEIKDVTESQDVNQGKLMMGFKTDIAPESDDYYKLLVMNSVFGSGTHSKLFMNVREKLSLAYYAYARLTRHKSVILVGSGIEFENFDKAKTEILFQLDEIRKGNVSDFELSASQKSLINAYKSMEDEPARIISAKTSNKILGVNISVDEIAEKINAVTKKDVVEMASHIWLDTIYFLKGKENE